MYFKHRRPNQTKLHFSTGTILSKNYTKYLVKIRCKFNSNLIGAITALSIIGIWDEGNHGSISIRAAKGTIFDAQFALFWCK